MKPTVEQMQAAMQAHAAHFESPEGQQIREAKSKYFQQVLPTYIENWPAELCRLSIAQVDVPLTLDEANAIGFRMMDFGEAFTPSNCDTTHVEHRVLEAVAKFPNGAFIRLGSRSPKDAWLISREGSMKVLPETNPLRFIMDASERMYEDLSLAIQNNYPPHIFVRQWIDLKPWQEFRCFMRKRHLVGISQYFYRDGMLPDVAENAETLAWVIEQFFPDFRTACHLDDVVFDVFVTRKQRGNDSEWEVKLLEINPFFEMTDPCLFDWRDGGDFDGSLRYIAANGETVKGLPRGRRWT